jgi:hypothetical protein
VVLEQFAQLLPVSVVDENGRNFDFVAYVANAVP